MRAKQSQVERRADDWIEFVQYGSAKAPTPIFRRGYALYLEAYEEPEITLKVIKEITGRFSIDELQGTERTEAKLTLSQLGAGPLQIVLLGAGTKLIGEIASTASCDACFQWTLRHAARNALPLAIKRRVTKAAGLSHVQR